jgi:hypothetical protein
MHRGSYFVLILVLVALLGAGLTCQRYTQHVFSTSHAFCYLATAEGEGATSFDFYVDAAFPKKEAVQLQKKMIAKVSAPELSKLFPENSLRGLEDPYHSFFEAERPLEGKVEQIFLSPLGDATPDSCWVKIVGKITCSQRLQKSYQVGPSENMTQKKLIEQRAIRCQVTIDTSLPPESEGE